MMTVELSNLHRQSLYTEQDAAACRLKVEARAHLRAINSDCRIEPFAERIDRLTIYRAAKGRCDGRLHGQFSTRFVLNDYAVKSGLPWVSAGVLGGEGQVLTFLPGQPPCLRCIMPSVPSCCGGDDLMATPAVSSACWVRRWP